MIPSALQVALQKYMFDLLQEKYQMHTNIVARVSHYLVTENDVREFSLLINDIYEKAYTKALKDYHVQLEAAGLKVAISYSKSDK
jgi:hypothetical protein